MAAAAREAHADRHGGRNADDDRDLPPGLSDGRAGVRPDEDCAGFRLPHGQRPDDRRMCAEYPLIGRRKPCRRGGADALELAAKGPRLFVARRIADADARRNELQGRKRLPVGNGQNLVAPHAAPPEDGLPVEIFEVVRHALGGRRRFRFDCAVCVDHHPARGQRKADERDADKLQDEPNDQPHWRIPRRKTRRSVEQESKRGPTRIMRLGPDRANCLVARERFGFVSKFRRGLGGYANVPAVRVDESASDALAAVSWRPDCGPGRDRQA